MSEQQPELEFCSRCRDHAEFEQDELGEWRSMCCGARAINVDVEPNDY